MKEVVSWSMNLMLVLCLCCAAWAQGTPPHQPDEDQLPSAPQPGTPPSRPQTGTLSGVKKMVKSEIHSAIMGASYPSVNNWRPLTTREKFNVFLEHTYSPRTFANAGVNAVKDKLAGDDREYERGAMGLGQLYGIELATSETDVFFERFLVPSLLKQDPRYFRNPDLPFFRRVAYSMSRVLITKADNGTETFNASRVLGGAASQAISDLYVPGQRQGLHPIANRVVFDLLVDSGFNLVHEFWPDVRRKLFRR